MEAVAVPKIKPAIKLSLPNSNTTDKFTPQYPIPNWKISDPKEILVKRQFKKICLYLLLK